MSKLNVEALLADPEFDVEHFLHNVNLHESKPEIIGTLVADPCVALSIAESPNWEILERHPGNPEDFIKFKDIGLELWTKDTNKNGNVWYGVIASDTLAINFRQVNYEKEVDLIRGKGTADVARSRFKQLKMHKHGEKKTNTAMPPGERPVDYVRSHLDEMIKKLQIQSNQGYYYGNRNSPLLRYHTGNRYANNTKNINVNVTTSGPYNLKVSLDPSNSSYVYRADKSWPHKKFSLFSDLKTKARKKPEIVAKDIYDWLIVENKILKNCAKKKA